MLAFSKSACCLNFRKIFIFSDYHLIARFMQFFFSFRAFGILFFHYYFALVPVTRKNKIIREKEKSWNCWCPLPQSYQKDLFAQFSHQCGRGMGGMEVTVPPSHQVSVTSRWVESPGFSVAGLKCGLKYVSPGPNHLF